jgi:HAD superfamily hydrolase (TIGR01490 family)
LAHSFAYHVVHAAIGLVATTNPQTPDTRMKKRIYAFDFDGTLTTRDTLIAFIRYAKGTRAFVLGFLLHAHLLVLMKLKLYPNWKAKQKVFSYFFKGMSLGDFDALCRHFAADNRQLLRPEGIRTLEQARADGADIVIVSASIDNWVKPFFTNLDGLADNLPKITVLGTQIEIADRKLTGRFLTKNCYGQEKVNRILALYPNRSEYTLTAYGDSRGDKKLLAFADEAHYKPFR